MLDCLTMFPEHISCINDRPKPLQDDMLHMDPLLLVLVFCNLEQLHLDWRLGFYYHTRATELYSRV